MNTLNTLKKMVSLRSPERKLHRHLASGSTKSQPASYFNNYLSNVNCTRLTTDYFTVPSIPGLQVAPGLLHNSDLQDAHQTENALVDDVFGDGLHAISTWESVNAVNLACTLWQSVKPQLEAVIKQRHIDTEFIRTTTTQLEAINKSKGLRHPNPKCESIMGKKDSSGRVIVGPLNEGDTNFINIPDTFRVTLPKHLQGFHVTLFGPHQKTKMAKHAIHAIESNSKNPVLDDIVSKSTLTPFWGADGEDSVTPNANDNMVGQHVLHEAFKYVKKFSETHPEAKLTQAIKRIPGIALPDFKHLLNGEPIPMHIMELAAHLFNNHETPENCSFYIPKIETEEEAHYLKTVIETCEALIKDINPDYKMGTVKVIIVFETARATFRMKEIAYNLSPYFAGGSLGWHDYLASAATLFEGVEGYQIPVKSDPYIVRNHIRESHELLEREMHAIGALAIGGMYGFLPVHNEDPELAKRSYNITMQNYIKDVIAQLHRGLDGFWVAHPQFVRLGIGLVEAFHQDKKSGKLGDEESLLFKLIDSTFLANPFSQQELKLFIKTVDRSTETLDPKSSEYPLAVLAANLKTSDVIANNDPREITYNITQTMEYLLAWFQGTGCVALPTTLSGAYGEKIPVRVMDDLATTERSLRELWAEIRYGRFKLEDVQTILQDVSKKLVQEHILQAIEEQKHKNEQKIFMSKPSKDYTAKVRQKNLSPDDIPTKQLSNITKWVPVAAYIIEKFIMVKYPPKNITEMILKATLDQVKKSEHPLTKLLELEAIAVSKL